MRRGMRDAEQPADLPHRHVRPSIGQQHPVGQDQPSRPSAQATADRADCWRTHTKVGQT